MRENGWLDARISRLRSVGGYAKPDAVPDSVKLDSNENYAVPRQFQTEILGTVKKADVREYPLGGTERLIGALSKFAGLPPQMIGVGNGSDQILDLILANLASKKTRVLTSDPTFGFFEDRCRLYGIPRISVPFSSEMRLDIADFERRAKDADILYLDSPNNPTGFQFPKARLQGLIRSFEGLVILDEAYAEFAPYSLLGMARRQENLVVVRTLSKSFGLAGLRLGYFAAGRRFTKAFMEILQYPYPLSTVTIEAGIAALSRPAAVRDAIAAVRSERQRIVGALSKYDAFEVFDSKANFVLFDARGAYKRIHSALAEQGISVRKLGKMGGRTGCLRVTVGTKEMNSRFLLAVRDLLG